MFLNQLVITISSQVYIKKVNSFDLYRIDSSTKKQGAREKLEKMSLLKLHNAMKKVLVVIKDFPSSLQVITE